MQDLCRDFHACFALTGAATDIFTITGVTCSGRESVGVEQRDMW